MLVDRYHEVFKMIQRAQVTFGSLAWSDCYSQGHTNISGCDGVHIQSVPRSAFKNSWFQQ